MPNMFYQDNTCTLRELIKHLFPVDRIGQEPDVLSAYAMKYLFRERHGLYVTEDFIISVWTELNGGKENVSVLD